MEKAQADEQNPEQRVRADVEGHGRGEQIPLEAGANKWQPSGESKHPRNEVAVARELLSQDDDIRDSGSDPEIASDTGG